MPSHMIQCQLTNWEVSKLLQLQRTAVVTCLAETGLILTELVDMNRAAMKDAGSSAIRLLD